MVTAPDRVGTVELYLEAHSDYASVNGYMANTKAAPGAEMLEGIVDEAVIFPGFGIVIRKGK